MNDLEKTTSQFTIVLRGYDRIQVDDYIDRLHLLLDSAEEETRVAQERARAAETRSPQESVGPRVTQILELATEEAEELREEAQRESSALVSNAQAQAQEMVSEARRSAEQAGQDARQEHAALLADLAGERDQVRAEVVLLERQRSELAAHLRRLHEAIGRFAAVADDAEPKDDDTLQTRQLKAVVSS